jgi:hypothetical protein
MFWWMKMTFTRVFLPRDAKNATIRGEADPRSRNPHRIDELSRREQKFIPLD